MKLFLQYFAEPTTEPTTPPTTPPTQPQTTVDGTKPADPASIAEALMHAIEERSRRASAGVVKSMADTYGMKPEELTAILDRAQAEKAKQLPPEIQQQLDAANQKVRDMAMAANVKSLGAAMGLVDADTALLLIDKSNIKFDDKGDATGIQEALDALKTSKPYLFGATKTTAWGMPQGKPENKPEGVAAAFAKINPTLKF